MVWMWSTLPCGAYSMTSVGPCTRKYAALPGGTGAVVRDRQVYDLFVAASHAPISVPSSKMICSVKRRPSSS